MTARVPSTFRWPSSRERALGRLLSWCRLMDEPGAALVAAQAGPESDSEIWRPVPDYPNYEVSSCGRARRATRFKHCPPGMVLAPRKNRFGYVQIALSKNGKYGHFGMHRLVALAFLGAPPSPRHQVAHGDRNRTNNRLENLRWATAVENAADRARHGRWLLARGEQHGQAILTDAKVLALRAWHRHGLSVTEAARRIGVNKITAWDAVRGKTWTHLPI
jgi:hypothetical protein